MATPGCEWEVLRQDAYASGRDFGAGPLQIQEGRVHYRVDPDDCRNGGIVDLDLAPRGADGLVAFSGDFTLIAPVGGRARKLLVDVPNRGRRLVFGQLNRATPHELLEDPCAEGDGFLFRRGFAVASIGWQWDAAGVGLDAPPAISAGAPVEGEVVCRIQPGGNRPSVGFGQLGEVAYPPADQGAEARLYQRDDDNAPLVELPRASWRFARLRHGAVAPDPRHIHLDGGFEKGRIYVLVYRARGSRVVGCGLLALRDATASLKAGDGPNGAGFDYAFAFGASQTGRVLRHLLYLGLNEDAAERRVFDGVHIHIAGGQRGDFNHRFAQPSSAGVPACGQLFPFAGATLKDPLGGGDDGLYRKLEQDRRRLMPRVVITNTSWEYWRGDAALTHVSPDGRRDVDSEPLERNYLFAGTQHIGGVLPPTNAFPLTGEKARYTFNVVDQRPLVRAAFANLEAWATRDQTPPPSEVPRLADGSLVGRDNVLARFDRLPDFKGLAAERLGGLSTLDLGPRADQGVCRFPAVEGAPYARLVCAVDESLNETAGIRLPDIAVPAGCHTGWNPRHPDHGASELPAMFVGFTRFAEQLPPSEEYERDVRAWTQRLTEARHVLEEDAERVIESCLIRYRLALDLAGRRQAAAQAAGR